MRRTMEAVVAELDAEKERDPGPDLVERNIEQPVLIKKKERHRRDPSRHHAGRDVT